MFGMPRTLARRLVVIIQTSQLEVRLLCAMLCNVFLSFALAFGQKSFARLFGLQRLLYLPRAIIVEFNNWSSTIIYDYLISIVVRMASCC
jgi:hypothetical protein